jgi:hypothetical protein
MHLYEVIQGAKELTQNISTPLCVYAVGDEKNNNWALQKDLCSYQEMYDKM